ncbi:hypothetical protein QP168_04850 [Aerococcus urinae]|uniref:Uncharacterized protein n=1 Tax=Aerococcus mictus TaxID=2976810 RepID=A0A1E9PLJ2_9LACT|nr:MULTISPECIES: hypothetical protein [Aerococcus]KAA9290414.1 hypothetical protein F6I06_08790 [Aerococcus mictus]MBU5610188.1 hypothetical protein [Aerococcus urinae]MCY3034902.1 hypothetical protein [Aerococcus mictus]MCY3063356.1 hypothetical protein [Aerococcus mictus]MCY3066030.1 hypothetical protein [Aerococcus mictus]
MSEEVKLSKQETETIVHTLEEIENIKQAVNNLLPFEIQTYEELKQAYNKVLKMRDQYDCLKLGSDNKLEVIHGLLVDRLKNLS